MASNFNTRQTTGTGLTNVGTAMTYAQLDDNFKNFTTGTSGHNLTINSITESSDKRLKENIKIIENPIEKVKQLEGVTYNKIKTPEFKETGLIAQDVEAVLPEAVNSSDDGMLAIAYPRLVGLLVEAIKEQQIQIDELKTQINEIGK